MFYYKIIIGCTILFLMLSIAILSVYQEYLYIEDLNKMEVYSYRKKKLLILSYSNYLISHFLKIYYWRGTVQNIIAIKESI